MFKLPKICLFQFRYCSLKLVSRQLSQTPESHPTPVDKDYLCNPFLAVEEDFLINIINVLKSPFYWIENVEAKGLKAVGFFDKITYNKTKFGDESECRS